MKTVAGGGFELKTVKVHHIQGKVKVDERTKRLVKRLRRGEIAVINHKDLDVPCAQGLLAAGVRAVVNVAQSLSGVFPAQGALLLVERGVPLIDEVDRGVLEFFKDGDLMDIHIGADGAVVGRDGLKFRGQVITRELLECRMEDAKRRLEATLSQFAENTFHYMKSEGYQILSQPIPIPPLTTPIAGRHVVVVARGANYREDLRTIRSYIREKKPILIGVDGGVEAILELGFKPDIILGDMDSVSDTSLVRGAELVVHAYTDGRAPGLERVRRQGLSAHLLPVVGTSEDAALLMAYELGAELIVAVGTHSSLVDFLEKGRMGMSSTFLTRLKVGHILVDAKGVSQLYSGKLKLWQVLSLLAVGALVAVLILKSPTVSSVARPLWLWLTVTLEQLWRAAL